MMCVAKTWFLPKTDAQGAASNATHCPFLKKTRPYSGSATNVTHCLFSRTAAPGADLALHMHVANITHARRKQAF